MNGLTVTGVRVRQQSTKNNFNIVQNPELNSIHNTYTKYISILVKLSIIFTKYEIWSMRYKVCTYKHEILDSSNVQFRNAFIFVKQT